MTSHGDVPNSLRENIFMLHMAINMRFCQLKSVFGDEEDDDVEPNNWYFELVEVRRLFRRFQDWTGHYPPVILEQKYDQLNSPAARKKRRELYQLYNKVYGIVTLLLYYCIEQNPEGPPTLINVMMRLLSETRQKIRSLNSRKRNTYQFKCGCAEGLLKIASMIYQCERWKLGLQVTPEYRYPSEDQENKDVDRPVYRMFPPGTIQKFQNEEHRQAAPLHDEHQQFPYSKDNAYSENGNVLGNPTGYDGERARLNGLTNGLANGHTNGHSYGNLFEVDDSVYNDLARHLAWDMMMNGLTDAFTNGHTNGLTNGNFNGYTNGNIDGNTDIGSGVNESLNTRATADNFQFSPFLQLPQHQGPLQPPPFQPQQQPPHGLPNSKWQWNGPQR